MKSKEKAADTYQDAQPISNAGVIRGLQLSDTQKQVSSGLRVQTASDNAAYWSISTTMRSDNMAISAVADALGLGAAKLDTTYAGLDAAKDILSEFRAKLVAAKEPGVDRSKIQKELDQLKEQLVSISTSASFNGVNWLNTEASQNLFELSSLSTDIVSSFIRSPNGSVKVGTTKLELANVSLFNTGGGGALQADPRILNDIGGFRTAALNDIGRAGTQTQNMSLPLTLAVAETISLDIDVDGTSHSLTIDKTLIDTVLGSTTGTISNAADYAAVLTQAISGSPIDNKVSISAIGSSLLFSSMETMGSAEASVTVGNILGDPLGISTGFTTPTTQTWQTADLPVTLSAGEAIKLRMNVDGAPKDLTIDKTLIDTVLGSNAGTINSAADYAAVLTQAFVIATIDLDVTVAVVGSSLQFDAINVSPSRSVSINGITRTPANSATGFIGTGTFNAGTTSFGDYAKTQFTFTSPFRIYRDVAFSFDLNVNGTAQQVSIDRNLVDAMLGTADGIINDASQMAQVLDAAMASLGIKVTASSSTIVLEVDPAMHPDKGTRSIINVSNVGDNIGRIANFDIVDVDITDPANSLDNYLNGLDVMLGRVTDAGATLGAVKTRIDMQTDFAQTLMDTLEKGIGRLVDADMNEASTRLKALQTQQQLAIQSLQIANSNAENIMQLFRQ